MATIELAAHKGFFCGGSGVNIRLVNTDGTECTTTSKDYWTLVVLERRVDWSGPELNNCTGMNVSDTTMVYLRTDEEYSWVKYFCPRKVTIVAHSGLKLDTEEIILQKYDRSTNNKGHQLVAMSKISDEGDF